MRNLRENSENSTLKSGLHNRKKRYGFRRVLAVCLLCVLCVNVLSLTVPVKAEAAGKKVLTLKAVKSAAVANSLTYEKLEGRLATKQVSLAQAVRSIKEKKRDMFTFRWSPLLKFHFPEKADLTDESEFSLKPVQIQAEIDVLKHQLTDQKLAEYETVSNLYVDILVSEDKIAFNNRRLAAMEDALEKNQARLKLGLAKESDVTVMENNITALTRKITSDTRTYENTKKKLGKKIDMDISTGYSFENTFVEASIDRDRLDDLITYTLDRNQNYYDVCIDEQTALTTLNTNYSLMRNQYGWKMNYISTYVNQARDGEKINTKAFKSSYETFLKKIDEPWQGKKRIFLFVKIPREWLKGKIDGIRYVEDEPYALYEAALEYQDALREKNATRDEIETMVEDTYNNYVSLRNAYLACVQDVEDMEKQLEVDEKLNRLGELTYDEYKTSLDDYEEAQNEMFEALAAYSKALYSFDRLTCGGVSVYLSEGSAELLAGDGGQSYVEEEYSEGAYYYIESIIQQQEFRLGVFIPDEFDVAVSHFELWCDNVQIGERTEVGKTIRHLTLSTESIGEAKIRFYYGNDFVDDCVIDPEQLSGPLHIVRSYNALPDDNSELGSYSYSVNEISGLVTVSMKMNGTEDIAAYSIKDKNGTTMLQKDPISIQKPFTYLSLIQSDMSDLTIVFYDAAGNQVCEGYFNTLQQKVMRLQEGQ